MKIKIIRGLGIQTHHLLQAWKQQKLIIVNKDNICQAVNSVFQTGNDKHNNIFKMESRVNIISKTYFCDMMMKTVFLCGCF